MIPKIIHYCWFGGKPLPALAEKCIASWKKFQPDFEIKRWDEHNFDVNSIAYTREAYAKRQFAFVSDYARFVILYKEGGIYFDTDVELLRPLAPVLASGPFMGDERPGCCNVGLGFGAEAGMPFLKEIIDFYGTLSFNEVSRQLSTNNVVSYVSSALRRYGYKDCNHKQQIAGFTIYPSEYFCPIDCRTKQKHMTIHTYSVHHYAESWVTPRMKIYERCKKIFGLRFTQFLAALLKVPAKLVRKF